MQKFSHINEHGKIKMVDVSHKENQLRVAKAIGYIKLSENTIKLIKENNIQKGDVLTVAKIAGIQSAKQTSALIPLCHPLQISHIDIQTNIENDGISVMSEVKCIGQTGVEMEALTSVSVALLTIYDMCKAVDKNMVIENIKLIEKEKFNL